MTDLIEPGKEFQNRYVIGAAIDSGGMGDVYLATDKKLACPVALKAARAAGDDAKAAFLREAQLLANLRHPSLPKVTDFFDEQGRQFLVMEFIPGTDFKRLLALNRRPFACAEVMRLADQILDALIYLHRQPTPVIHRDIKPANLKRTPDGQVVLLDFGLAKGRAGQMDEALALQSIRRQTMLYASPEHSTGGTDQRSDLFSLAATLYHLLTKEPAPYAEMRALVRIKSPDPLRLASEINGEVPRAIAEALHRGLALDPDERFQTAAEMREALRSVECTAG